MQPMPGLFHFPRSREVSGDAENKESQVFMPVRTWLLFILYSYAYLPYTLTNDPHFLHQPLFTALHLRHWIA